MACRRWSSRELSRWRGVAFAPDSAKILPLSLGLAVLLYIGLFYLPLPSNSVLAVRDDSS